MINDLIKLANDLDQKGLHSIANTIDEILVLAAKGGRIDIKKLIQMKPEIEEQLGRAINFDLVVEPGPEGTGSHVKAIPRIVKKWLFSLKKVVTAYWISTLSNLNKQRNRSKT